MKLHVVNKSCACYKEKLKRIDTNIKKTNLFTFSFIYIFMNLDDGLLWPKHAASSQQNNVLQ